MIKLCENCRTEFEPRCNQRFCCGKCYNKRYYQENIERFKERGRMSYQNNKEKIKERSKKYHQEHKEESISYQKRYRQEHPKKIRKQKKKYYRKNKEKIKEYKKNYRQENKEKFKERKKISYQNNKEKVKEERKKYCQRPESKKIRNMWQKKIRLIPKNKINNNVSGAIRVSLKSKKNGKSWETLVGYTLKDLMEHLKKQFDSKMSWENYGSYWEIDHIKPKSLFTFSSYEDKEFKGCWDLSNLQPLESIENRSKGNRYE